MKEQIYEVSCRKKCQCEVFSETPLSITYRRLETDPRENLKKHGIELYVTKVGDGYAEPKNVVDFSEDDFFWFENWPIEVLNIECRYNPNCEYLTGLRERLLYLQKERMGRSFEFLGPFTITRLKELCNRQKD